MATSIFIISSFNVGTRNIKIFAKETPLVKMYLNSYVEALTPNVTVFADRTFGK